MTDEQLESEDDSCRYCANPATWQHDGDDTIRLCEIHKCVYCVPLQGDTT